LPLCRDWQALIHKYGGRVLGFYFDEAHPDIDRRAKELIVSFEEKIMDKLDI